MRPLAGVDQAGALERQQTLGFVPSAGISDPSSCWVWIAPGPRTAASTASARLSTSSTKTIRTAAIPAKTVVSALGPTSRMAVCDRAGSEDKGLLRT